MSIAEEDIRKVRDDTDIVSLIEEHTSLKRSGRSMTGLCVFHDERTPSMSVSPNEGFYHCFGCGASGDSITFVREKLGMEFQDAVEMLADRLGYTLRYTSTRDTKAHGDRKKQREIIEKAMLWYHEQLLKSEEAGPARAYLKSRGYDKKIVEKWKLGWAPNGRDNLTKALGVSASELQEVELAFVNSSEVTDFFRSRILFPIFNHSSNTVGFGGRIMPGVDGPKYINSRDSAIYQKRKELYGFHLASKHIVSEDRAVVVEGYTDVIGMEDIGISECIATCGTSLTEDHLRKLSRLSHNVVLVFDPDTAGSSAMSRSDEALMALEELEIEIKVAKLPGDEDPGDLANTNPEALLQALDSAIPLLEFNITELLSKFSLDTNDERYRASQQAGQMIAKFFARAKKASISALKEKYVNLVAEMTQVSAAAIFTDIKSSSASPVTSQVRVSEGNFTERQILLWAIHIPEEIPDYVNSDFFEFETEKNLFDGLLNYASLQEARTNMPEASAQLLTELNALDPPQGEIDDHLARIIFAKAERIHEQMDRELQNLINKSDSADLKEIEERYLKLSPLKVKIDQVRQNRLKLNHHKYSTIDLLNWLQEEKLLI